ncbi:MAG TPA: dephospho-CoA kinase [Gemmataceae bacterium]|jgi:dephospho-CoA kinase
MTSASAPQRPTHQAPRVVGLIGGMGSGKSEAAAAFARHGALVVSGDRAGHEALRQAAIKEQIFRRWGRNLLDEKGEVNRKKLAGIVFRDPSERQKLEEIVFPWIERSLQEQIEAAKRNRKVSVIVLDAAILLEAGWSKKCDKLVFVDAPRSLRLRRLAEARGWNEKEVQDREQAQLPLNEKRNRADAVLGNSGSLEELNRQVEELFRRWGIDDDGKRKNDYDSSPPDAADDNNL